LQANSLGESSIFTDLAVDNSLRLQFPPLPRREDDSFFGGVARGREGQDQGQQQQQQQQQPQQQQQTQGTAAAAASSSSSSANNNTKAAACAGPPSTLNVSKPQQQQQQQPVSELPALPCGNAIVQVLALPVVVAPWLVSWWCLLYDKLLQCTPRAQHCLPACSLGDSASRAE
jgi:hypothetical protein